MRKILSFFKSRNKVTPPEYRISSLAPKVLHSDDDIRRIQPYLDIIKKALDDKDITNIALTGGYGSGKSTIIKTFQSRYKYKYLNISLASFKDVKEKGDKEDKNGKENLERHLEVSILQQIFYHVKPSDIPDSRFKRIVNITKARLWGIALGLIIWIMAALILFRFDYVAKINPSSWSLDRSLDGFAIFVFIIFFTGVGLLAKDLVRLFTNSKINKFTIKGELELGDKLDKSVFNEHLEEIIYFFERTDYDVVVIEDLDRFESTDIFTKLREINILLNNSNLIKRDVNFLYAIRDEMFQDKSERVKFFEYIIPVIPFINPSNAADQLARLINEANLEGVLSKDFTEDVVTFIDDIDMRLLTNIFHEYVLYKQNLDAGLNQDELFAIIIYKNLYPDDFGKLNKRRGKLYEFLTGKSKYISKLMDEIDAEIGQLKSRLESAQRESAESLKELRAVYIYALHSLLPDAIEIYIDRDLEKPKDLIEEEAFTKFSRMGKIKYKLYKREYNNKYYLTDDTSELSFSDIETHVNPDFTYRQRRKMINDKSTEQQTAIKAALQELQARKSEIKNCALKRIFEEIDIEPFLKSFANNLLMRNLLLSGYINENYNDYISLFHEISITKEDFTFIRSVKSGVNTPFDYQLTRMDNLIIKIPPKYFGRDAVLNFDLMDYLGDNYYIYKEQYHAIVRNISSDKKRTIEFVDGYVERATGKMDIFIREIAGNWKGFWDSICKRDYTPEKHKRYLKLILQYVEVNDIVDFKKGVNIASFIEKLPDFLELMDEVEDKNKIKEAITLLRVSFDALQKPSEGSMELFDYVYENSHYKINSSNIALFAIHYGRDVTPERLNTANYTTICESGCNTLKEYINNNIHDYVKNVLLRNTENTKESQVYLNDLLNDENLKVPLKIELIKSQEAIIADITKIDQQELHKPLFQYNKVAPHWANLFRYYESLESKELDEILADFLNRATNYEVLSQKKIKEDTEKGQEFIKQFILSVAECDRLSLEAYQHLMKPVTNRWKTLSFENLSKDKVRFLIEEDILSLSSENFRKLRAHFVSDELHILFIEKHFDDFTDEYDEYDLEEGDISILLQLPTLSDDQKIRLLGQVENKTIIENAGIGKLACKLYAISSQIIPVDYKMLESFFDHSPSTEYKIRVLNKQIDDLSNPQIESLITSLREDYPEIFKKQHKPKFQDNEYHRELFQALRKIKLIKDVAPHPKYDSYLRVTANYT